MLLVGLVMALAAGCTHPDAGPEPSGSGVIGEATPTATPMVGAKDSTSGPLAGPPDRIQGGGVLIYASEAPGAQSSLTAWHPTGTVEALTLVVDDPLGSARIS